MTESSEQCSYENTLEQEDVSSTTETFVVAKYEDFDGQTLTVTQNEEHQGEQQVYGYLELQPSDTESATIILQPQGLAIDGQHLILTQNDSGNEIIVVVSTEQDHPQEQSFSQSSVVHPCVTLQSESSGLAGGICVDESRMIEFIETEEVSQDIEKGDPVYVEQQCELAYVDPESNPFGNVAYVPVKGGNAEMVFIPPASVLTSPAVIVSADEPQKNGELLTLAIAAEGHLESNDTKSSSEEVNLYPFTRGSFEGGGIGSVIVSQGPSDADSTSLCHETESKEEVSSEQDCNSNTCDENANLDLKSEQDTSRKVSPVSCYTSPLTIDNAVSVIHATSSTYAYDNSLRTSIKSKYILREYIKDPNNIAQDTNGKSEEVISEISEHEISDQNELIDSKLTIQDEDSSSQNCCLDLTKDSLVERVPCDEDMAVSVEEQNGECTIAETANNAGQNEHTYVDVEETSYIDLGEKNEDTNSNDVSSRSSIINVDDESKGEDIASNNECEPMEVDTEMNSGTDISVDNESSTVKLSESTDKLNIVDAEQENTGILPLQNINSDAILKTESLDNKSNSKSLALSDDSQSSAPVATRDSRLTESKPIPKSPAFSDDSQSSTSITTRRSRLLENKSNSKSPAFSDDSHSSAPMATRSTRLSKNKSNSKSPAFSDDSETSALMATRGSRSSENKSNSKSPAFSDDSQTSAPRATRSSKLSQKKSNFKNSTFSDDSQSSAPMVARGSSSLKSRFRKIAECRIDPKPKVDEYEFENSSSNPEQELSSSLSLPHQPSQTLQNSEVEMDSTEISEAKIPSTNGIEEKKTLNLSFRGALHSVIGNKEDEAEKVPSVDEHMDQSGDLFENATHELENKSSATLENSVEEFPTSYGQSNSEKASEKEKEEFLDVKTISNDSIKEKPKVARDPSPSEETSVKPPKRTYIRKKPSDSKASEKQKIELFSCDDLSATKDSDTLFYEDTLKDADKVEKNHSSELENDDDDLVLGLKSRVSATYKREKKTPLVKRVQEIRSRSLRSRFSQSNESLENGTAESAGLDDLEKVYETKEKEDSESRCWGDILMGTSFNIAKSKDDPPESEPPSSPRKTARTTLPPPDHSHSPKVDRSTESKEQWEKLMKSSPTKVKTHKITERRKLIEKIKKQAMKFMKNPPTKGRRPSIFSKWNQKEKNKKKGKERDNSKNLNGQFPSPNRKSPKQPRQKKTVLKRVKFGKEKRSDIVYKLEVSSRQSASDELKNMANETPGTSFSANRPKRYDYNCQFCSFASSRVNNVIMHMKFCLHKKHPSHEINYSVNDMEKRQRIRGEDLSEKVLDTSGMVWNLSDITIRNINKPETSHDVNMQDSDDDETDETEKTNKNGFSKNEMVWAKVQKRFWPAIIRDLDKDHAFLYLISKNRGIKVNIKSGRLHSFNDAKWNKRLLEEAASLPDNDALIKAVQESDSYARKNVIYDHTFDAKEFFNIPENVEFPSDNESSDCDIIEEILDEDCETPDETSPIPEKTLDYVLKDTPRLLNGVNIPDIMECILKGRCNEHVVSVYMNSTASERHDMFFKDDADSSKRLKDMSWFGPFKEDSTMQTQLYDFLYELFESSIGKLERITAYIYVVWIPEAIIKAISLIKDTNLKAAETIFHKQDTINIMNEDEEKMDVEDT